MHAQMQRLSGQKATRFSNRKQSLQRSLHEYKKGKNGIPVGVASPKAKIQASVRIER